MSWLNKLPGFQRTPYGFEWRLLRLLPHILLAGYSFTGVDGRAGTFSIDPWQCR